MAVSQGSIIESMEQICSNLNRDEFVFSFLDAYGFAKSTITRLRNGDDSRNVAVDSGDVGLRKQLYFSVLEPGSDVATLADTLKTSDVVTRNDIRFVIATDFEDVVAYDLKADERLDVPFDELAQNYAFFLPLAGYEKAVMYSEHPADLKASEKMGQLFDLIRERNDLTKPEDIHALNVFLTRLLFCFYAEDTGIFDEGQLSYAIQSYTQEDGSDLDQFFTDLFAVLNLDDSSPERQKMPAHFQAFKFVNGGLFRDDEPVPEFGRKARRILLDCARLDWSEINPDIFGSMFQAVIDEEQRGNLGQHYTSVSNIMKVIQPLFLDPLYAELEKARGNEKRLKALLVRIGALKVFDPACGSGNFLIIAYKELRRLEMQIIDALNSLGQQSEIYYSGIRLNQFYGIEIDDFACEIAALSLWLAEHQMNVEFKAKFGYSEAALPLKDGGNVVCGNSLQIDWELVCPTIDAKGNAYEVFICGNPPFLGKGDRTKEQTNDMGVVFGKLRNYKNLDLVSCWFMKAKNIISKKEHKVDAAFVATNSIAQGEQVGILWPAILNEGVRILFAYQTFSWKNSARMNAGVHVVIIGITRGAGEAALYVDSEGAARKLTVDWINPYLIPAKSGAVTSVSYSLSSAPRMVDGNNYTKSGGLLLTPQEKEALLKVEPESFRWIRQFVGGDEFINSRDRYCLWLLEATEKDINSMPVIKQRIESVRQDRLESQKKETREKASQIPHLFPEIRQPEKGDYLLVPRVTSERRKYIPIGYLPSSVITSNQNLMIPEGTLYEFGILTSEMHNDWMRAVAGRLESRYRYSATLVYNTFPWPEISEPKRKKIEELAEEVILTREDYPDKTLAELYDPDKMPKPLLDAHKALDKAVEALYRERPFRDVSERLEHLFGRYERLIAAEKAKSSAKKTKKG